MSTGPEQNTTLDHAQTQHLFGKIHKRLNISVDFNSYDPPGLQFWTQLESDLTRTLGLDSIENREASRKNLLDILEKLLGDERITATPSEVNSLLDQIMDHYFGYGLLEGLLREDAIYEILINDFKEIYFSSRGRLQRASVSFLNDAHLLHVIERLCIRNNINLPSAANPIIEFTLSDNSSVIIVTPPVTPISPSLSIHRAPRNPITIDQLIQFGSLSVEMMQFIKAAVEARLNILVCGYTGSGSSTLLNIVSSFIPGDERVLSIENGNSSSLRINHLVKLIAKESSDSENTHKKLLAVAEKMRGDRLILEEFVSADAYDILNSINDNFSGSIVRMVAKSPADAVERLETFIQLEKTNLPYEKIRRLISSSIDVIIYQERLGDRSRVVKNIVEVPDNMASGEHIALKEIFGMEQIGVKDGRILRKFISYRRPSEKLMNKIDAAGIELPATMFGIEAGVEMVQELTEKDKRSIKLSKGNYVFISYSTRNLNRVLPLARELEKKDFYVWLDKWYLEPGEDWSKGLEKAIRNAGAFIVILTRDSVDAPAVRNEIMMALDESLPIIPIKLEDCNAPIQIKALQYILCDEHDMATAIDSISESLSKYVSNERLFGDI